MLQYDIEVDCDEHGPVVSSVVLTLKHVILFYANGRIEWLLKYYPDLMEEEQASKRPFSFDKFLELQKPISHALYDHYFDKLLLSHTDGFFSVLAIQAETNQADEEEEEHPKKNKEKSKKIELDVDYLGPYHTTAIILIREIEHTPFCLTVSCDGRFMVWSLK